MLLLSVDGATQPLLSACDTEKTEDVPAAMETENSPDEELEDGKRIRQTTKIAFHSRFFFVDSRVFEKEKIILSLCVECFQMRVEPKEHSSTLFMLSVS